jgi:Bacteroidetes-specific putative membrane protein
MSSIKYGIVLSLSLLAGHAKLFSQETSVYTNYFVNTFLINPATTGIEAYPLANISARKQWVGMPNSPSTYLVTGNYRIGKYDFYDPKMFVNKGPLKLKDRIGLGAALYRDNNGPLTNTGFWFSYAYHMPMGNGSQLSFGMSLIGVQHTLNNSQLKPNQMGDSYLLEGSDNAFRLNTNFGVNYLQDAFFAGVSCNKFLKDVENPSNTPQQLPSYFLMAGYKFMKGNITFNYEPSLVIKKLSNNVIAIDVHNKFYIKRLNWIAFSYSTTGQVDFRVGLHLVKMLYLGYNYEYTMSKVSLYSFGTHEISLGINLGLTGVDGIRSTVKE